MNVKQFTLAALLLPYLSIACSTTLSEHHTCSSSDINTSVVDIKHCVKRDDVKSIKTFGGNIPTAHFAYESGLEYSIAYIPSSLATNGLHTKYDISVKSFFSQLYENDPDNRRFQLIRSAYDIDSHNKLVKFEHQNFDAYAVIGDSKADSIYIITNSNDFLYHIVGDFSEIDAKTTLAKMSL